jgi:hypothetical protein
MPNQKENEIFRHAMAVPGISHVGAGAKVCRICRLKNPPAMLTTRRTGDTILQPYRDRNAAPFAVHCAAVISGL